MLERRHPKVLHVKSINTIERPRKRPIAEKDGRVRGRGGIAPVGVLSILIGPGIGRGINSWGIGLCEGVGVKSGRSHKCIRVIPEIRAKVGWVGDFSIITTPLSAFESEVQIVRCGQEKLGQIAHLGVLPRHFVGVQMLRYLCPPLSPDIRDRHIDVASDAENLFE